MYKGPVKEEFQNKRRKKMGWGEGGKERREKGLKIMTEI